jgi:hypothetical protein
MVTPVGIGEGTRGNSTPAWKTSVLPHPVVPCLFIDVFLRKEQLVDGECQLLIFVNSA